MKIDWKEYQDKDHVFSWLLVEAMSKIGINNFGDFDSSLLEVEFKVNGIDVPLVETMEFLQTQLKEIEENGRREGLKEAKYAIQENIDELINICVQR